MRLHAYTQDDKYHAKAEETLEVFAGVAEQFGIYAGTYGIAAVWLSQPHTQIVVIGEDERAEKLLQVAHAVDRNLETYREKEDTGRAVAIRERICVCISSNPAAQYLIARGARMAQAMDGEFHVVYIDRGQDTSEANQKSLAANIHFAENVGATISRLEGRNVAKAVAQFVLEKHVTQVVFGRSATRGWKRFFYLTAIHQFLRDAPSVDVHIVTQEPN